MYIVFARCGPLVALAVVVVAIGFEDLQLELRCKYPSGAHFVATGGTCCTVACLRCKCGIFGTRFIVVLLTSCTDFVILHVGDLYNL